MSKQKYTWGNLSEKWNSFLLSDKFVVKDCAKDGNCQFSSISEALKQQTKISYRKLRKLVSDYIIKLSDSKFKDILQSYKLEQENGEFYGNWNPENIKTKKQFAKEIRKTGFNFEGDYTTLSLLNSALRIDFIIFNENTISITKIESERSKSFILLNFRQIGNTGHYQTIGLMLNKKPSTIFNKLDLPKELELIFNKNKFFTKHIKNIYKEDNNIKCNEILLKLTKLVGFLTRMDKKVIFRVLAKFV